MGEAISEADDLMNVGDAFGGLRIDGAQPIQRLPDNAPIALDNLSKTTVIEVVGKGFSFFVLRD